MKKFIKKLILFLLPILIFGIIFEIILRIIPNDYCFKNDYLTENSDRITTLILGSSHAYYGLNPNYMGQNTFNAAYVSQSVDLDLAIYNKFNDKMHNLKHVIIPIDYFTLFSKLDQGAEKWRLKNYNIYYRLNSSNNPFSYIEVLNGDFKNNLKKGLGYYLKNSNYLTTSNNGFGVYETLSSKVDLNETGKTASKRHTKKEFTQLNENLNLLEELLNVSNKKNVKVIFYTSPAHKSYVSNLNSTQLNLTYSTINQLTEKYSNSYYYNFLENKDFTKEDYYDADHLNRLGAKKLSIKLDSIIKAIDTK